MRAVCDSDRRRFPITGQTFAVLLTGALLGSRLGAAAVIAFVEGALGLPFFAAGGSGLVRFLDRGYLIAFPAAAFVTGAFAEFSCRMSGRNYTAVVAMAIGSVIILVTGWIWCSILANVAGGSFQLAVLRFLPGDVIKIALAAAVLPTGWALLKRKASGDKQAQ